MFAKIRSAISASLGNQVENSGGTGGPSRSAQGGAMEGIQFIFQAMVEPFRSRKFSVRFLQLLTAQSHYSFSARTGGGIGGMQLIISGDGRTIPRSHTQGGVGGPGGGVAHGSDPGSDSAESERAIVALRVVLNRRVLDMSIYVPTLTFTLDVSYDTNHELFGWLLLQARLTYLLA
ncbi:hypothetical protein C8R45DRAFT_1098297 [Mycena sanguinolenta]|nr:hypothetical protein C8R45DRAFT_1098297 [Mycena sanguinolenta]